VKNLCLGLFFVVIATSASLARAQDREHDGFMARFTGGFGYGSASEKIDDASLEVPFSEWGLSGPGVAFSADVGAAPIPNFVLHARFGAMVVSSPTVEFDGMEAELDDIYGDNESSLTFILLGPAATYYIMPVNIYLTAAVGVGLVGVKFGNNTGRTDPGWALNFDAGWEFWVGRSWGMGPAVRLFYTSVPDAEDLTVNGGGFALLFSATFQ
jgi:hypothetical protein